MRKNLIVAMVACAAAFSHVGAHAEWSCGGALTQKQADAIENDSREIASSAKLLLGSLIIDALYGKKTTMFSLDGGDNAIGALQHAEDIQTIAGGLQKLVPIRDGASGKTKQQLEAHINEQLLSIRIHADFISGGLGKLQKISSKQGLDEIGKLDRFTKNFLGFLKDCKY